MRDELLLYYERELRFIRNAATEFAEKYPEVAGRLLLEPTKCEDPHVERLIEAFAMLAARVHLRLDDDFSEVSHALLGVLYPHYLRPVPSSTIVQMSLDPEQSAPEDGLEVERHTILRSRPVDGVRCLFRTCYPVRLWPIEIASVDLVPVTGASAQMPPQAKTILRIRLRGQRGVSLADLRIPSLRVFLNDQSGSLHVLYELLLRDAIGLGVRWGEAAPVHYLDASHIRPVGFGRDEGLLEYPPESFVGYRLLQEYFSFADKFLFVDFKGLERAPRPPGTPPEFLELAVLLEQSLATIDVRFTPDKLQLGCVPAVNLFPMRADPIRLTHTATEYAVTPDARAPQSYEVYSITEVASATSGSSKARTFDPFYAVRHGRASAGSEGYWFANRRASMRRDDPGTDLHLSLVDERFDPLEPAAEVLHVEALCTNRDLPARLAFGDPRGDFQIEGRPAISKIRCLRKPTAALRPPMDRDARWRVVSHLALNYLSLADGRGGESDGRGGALDALREILRIYDFTDSPASRQRIAGLIGLATRKIVRRTGHGSASGFARGLEVDLLFDESLYTGSGVFLFASVLDRFLGLYTAVNSFTQTVARSRQREQVLKKWPPRAGEIELL